MRLPEALGHQKSRKPFAPKPSPQPLSGLPSRGVFKTLTYGLRVWRVSVGALEVKGIGA